MPNFVRPVLKWVGGKRQLIPALSPLLPAEMASYYEPFLGGGAMLFHLQPKTAHVSDINADLMRVYAVIKDDVDALIEELRTYRNDADFFYAVREWDRDKRRYERMSDVRKAARALYLNKTCFNGLYRVNNAGEFNAPFGNYKRPNIVNASALRAVSAYFQRADVRFSAVDYAAALADAAPGAFAYLDPPYDPVSDTSNFTGYARGGFSRAEQIRLRECCDMLTRRGVRFMLSNSATDFIREQYRNYNITLVKARRAVNSIGTRRGDVDEVVIRNYE